MPRKKKTITTQTNEPVQNRVQLTQTGLEELKSELAELTDVKLPAVIVRLAAARAHGDLSENAEYHNAKEEQSFLETRMSEIQDILERAEIVNETSSKSKVGIGSMVKVHRLSDSKKSQTFHIVGEFESDPQEGKVSAVSPVGKALIGKKVSDQVEVVAPAGTITYVIDSIS